MSNPPRIYRYVAHIDAQTAILLGWVIVAVINEYAALAEWQCQCPPPWMRTAT
jgi:hypothetical protein